jgi:hypothetical protein
MDWEGWRKEHGEGCIQKMWPYAALDLDAARQSSGVLTTRQGRQAREAKVQIQLSLKFLPNYASD